MAAILGGVGSAAGDRVVAGGGSGGGGGIGADADEAFAAASASAAAAAVGAPLDEAGGGGSDGSADDEEPMLKYIRLGGSLNSILKSESISAMDLNRENLVREARVCPRWGAGGCARASGRACMTCRRRVGVVVCACMLATTPVVGGV